MLEITLDDKAFRFGLAELYRRLGDLEPAMRSVGMELESRISGRFETRKDPLGKAWERWSPSTEASYPRTGSPAAKKAGGVGNGRILDRYGDMLLSLNHKANQTSVRIGFGQPYSTYHEFGTKYMPRRGMIYADPVAGTLAPSDEASVLDVLGTWLTRPIN